MLPLIADAVGDRLDLILDGGIRSGGDVVKALALGAKTTAVGRSWVWGAAAAGERGVQHVLSLYRSEIEETLMLLGCVDVASLDRSWADYPAAWHAKGSTSRTS